MSEEHAIQTKLEGYVVMTQNGPDSLGFGTYTRNHPTYLKERGETQQSPVAGVAGNVRRTRHIAREYHGWDLPDESELRHQAMEGET
ncbi:hypothetical protein [Haloarcula sp. Atlit-120R]|uniref:hypothetical protein n=1 Tax=Haloarcula sp. Atlit-120R TaxID=2282135 RepID=UPI000EF1D72D|nr:hypothetical protein [Haloarcula sp. Atlit-120R]RLM33145.1 hypothetical protein DVK01_18295 [Haloarcula sp. Atlit-120R]